PAAAHPPPASPAAESVTVRYDQEPDTGPPIDESQVSKIALAETVEFAPDEITLPQDATGLLDKLAMLLSRDSTIVRLEIGGHAHPGGKGELEQRNSLRRATYVKNYLVEKGIEAPRLRIEGYGSSKPLSKGTGAEDRRKNDRVEFVLWRQKK
ncbi:MAG: OmpA family protein, partial [Bdellovibrionota bacterium]